MSQKYAGLVFRSQKVLIEWLKDWPAGQEINGDRLKVLGELFVKKFPEYESTPAARWRFVPRENGGREAQWLDVAGQWNAFSINDVVKGVEKTLQQKVTDALRAATWDHRREYRDTFFATNVEPRCELSGVRVYSVDDVEVDHYGEHGDFCDLRDEWLAANGGVEAIAIVHTDRGWRMSDPYQLASFDAFHRANAKLRVLERSVHQRRTAEQRKARRLA